MRNNQPVTQRERSFAADQRLISTTNLKGVITYCNDVFVEISGFTREELVGTSHNLVRHPDVPPAVFAHMWADLKAGKASASKTMTLEGPLLQTIRGKCVEAVPAPTE